MLKALKSEANKTETLNGNRAYHSTMNDVLDFFSRVGALRGNPKEAEFLFKKAYRENPDLAMKALFFARDIRGGLGERGAFRQCIKWLGSRNPKSLLKNLEYVAEYGRWDDLLCLLDVRNVSGAVVSLIKKQFIKDLKTVEAGGTEVSLLGKWMPSANTSSKDTRRLANKLIRKFKISPKSYRQGVVKLREVIGILENNLREKDYTFDYSKQPSQAMLKYRKAFLRNDGERYTDYIESVKTGKTKINTGTLDPVQIVHKLRKLGYDSESDLTSLDTMWKELPDYTRGENALVVCDSSGSMTWTTNGGVMPLDVSESLAIYFAERNKGAFKDYFITFSNKPKLVHIDPDLTLDEKLKECHRNADYYNTDIEATFKLILDAAVKNKVPQSELPKRLYIISDMQFDEGSVNSDLDSFETAKMMYSNAGYELPQVVYWNVNDYGNSPVTGNRQGCCLVSGYSARIFDLIKSDDMNPIKVMEDILNSERYAVITV